MGYRKEILRTPYNLRDRCDSPEKYWPNISDLYTEQFHQDLDQFCKLVGNGQSMQVRKLILDFIRYKSKAPFEGNEWWNGLDDTTKAMILCFMRRCLIAYDDHEMSYEIEQYEDPNYVSSYRQTILGLCKEPRGETKEFPAEVQEYIHSFSCWEERAVNRYKGWFISPRLMEATKATIWKHGDSEDKWIKLYTKLFINVPPIAHDEVVDFLIRYLARDDGCFDLFFELPDHAALWTLAFIDGELYCGEDIDDIEMENEQGPWYERVIEYLWETFDISDPEVQSARDFYGLIPMPVPDDDDDD